MDWFEGTAQPLKHAGVRLWLLTKDIMYKQHCKTGQIKEVIFHYYHNIIRTISFKLWLSYRSSYPVGLGPQIMTKHDFATPQVKKVCYEWYVHLLRTVASPTTLSAKSNKVPLLPPPPPPTHTHTTIIICRDCNYYISTHANTFIIPKHQCKALPSPLHPCQI